MELPDEIPHFAVDLRGAVFSSGPSPFKVDAGALSERLAKLSALIPSPGVTQPENELHPDPARLAAEIRELKADVHELRRRIINLEEK